MTNPTLLAEMVNQANYAAMSYNELVTLNFAYLLAEGDIKPLIDNKRTEEMERHTDEFVKLMDNYGASKDELLALIEKKALRDKPYGPTRSQNVDEPTPTANTEDYQDKGESVLALPKSFQTTETEDSATTPVAETIDVEDQNNDADLDGSKEEDSSDEEDTSVQKDSTSADVSTDLDTTPTPILVEAVIEIAKRGRIPDDIDVNSPYFVVYTICHDTEGNLWREDISGRNLDAKDLESFRTAHKTHVRLFRKKEVMMSTKDYLVYREDNNKIKVTFYHLTEQDGNGVESSAPKVDSYSNQIPYDVTVDLHKTHRRMRRAIEKAKEYSASIGSSSSPYYDKYIFHDNNATVELNGNPERVIEDEETLIEIKAAFETFARHLNAGTVLISEDNCVVAKVNDKIYLVLFNFHGQTKESTPVKKKRRKAIKEINPKTKDTVTPTEDPLIIKAVEMTKALPICNGTDVNAPFFIQCEFSVMGDGELFQKGKPFIKNVSGEDELGKLKRNHLRFAKTMKAVNPVSTEHYTAYFWNEGKNLSVFYYNTKGLTAAA